MRDHLRGLPPTRVYQGDRDILLPDVELFARKARARGADIRLRVEPGGIHDYVVLVSSPEARAALDSVAAFVSSLD